MHAAVGARRSGVGQQFYSSGPDGMWSNVSTKSRVTRSSADFPDQFLNCLCWLGQWTYPYILGEGIDRGTEANLIYSSLEKLSTKYSPWFVSPPHPPTPAPLHIWKPFGGELWESSSPEHWQIFLNSINGSLMPGQNTWLNITLTGSFISSIPLAQVRTSFLQTCLNVKSHYFFFLSSE